MSSIFTNKNYNIIKVKKSDRNYFGDRRSDNEYFYDLMEEIEAINKLKIKSEPKVNLQDEETKIPELQCCVCLVNKKCVLFERCGHIPACISCSKNLKDKCPLCRVEKQTTRAVFN
jgi:hypothetical protein